jgi:DNA-binding transcriptional ArsR family regulator
VTRPVLDPVIHAPARLQIMAVLAGVQDAEFALLRQITQVSDSVLSKHLAQLQEAGYVRLRKAAQDGRQRTWAALTSAGRRAFSGHVQALEDLVRVARQTPASAEPAWLDEPAEPADVAS